MIKYEKKYIMVFINADIFSGSNESVPPRYFYCSPNSFLLWVAGRLETKCLFPIIAVETTQGTESLTPVDAKEFPVFVKQCEPEFS